MPDYQLSEAEKFFIIRGIEINMREDGRQFEDYNYISVAQGVIPNANGSSRILVSETDVIVAVKAEVCSASPETPARGFIQFFVDCSATATPLFEGRGGESTASSITNCLTRAYTENTFDYKSLCIYEGQYCWCLHIDIVVVEIGGSVFDAVSLAVKAALCNTSLPVVTVTEDGGIFEIDVSDDPSNVSPLDVSLTPIFVTVSKIGSRHIVDATLKEEACSIASLLVAVTEKGDVTYTRTRGKGSLQPASLLEMLQTAVKVGQELNNKLYSTLQQSKSDISSTAASPFFIRSKSNSGD